jgi:predicted AlkP superfamily phosphohydrolase/phosphomutase
MTSADPAAERAFLLGLDGVPHDGVQRYVEAGHLPNLARLATAGVTGPLASTQLSARPVAWTSTVSGKLPDAHGVYGHLQIDDDYRQRPYSSADVRTARLWDVLAPAVLGNVPLTYPAPAVDGTVVSGPPAPAVDRQATHPSGLAEEFADAIPPFEDDRHWRDHADDPDAFLDAMVSRLEARHDLLERLMAVEDWRLFCFVLTTPARIHRLTSDDDVLLACYRALDDVVGDVMAYCEDRNATLYVVSGRGSTPVDKRASVNRILADAGYLSPRVSDDTDGLTGSLRERVRRLLSRADGLDEGTLSRPMDVVGESPVDSLPGVDPQRDVSYENSRAFCFGSESVYVNDGARFESGTVSPSERDRVASEVERLLTGVTDPQTGERVLSVYDGDVRFNRDDRSPDLVVVPRDGYVTDDAVDAPRFERVDAPVATPRGEGVFFAWGPTVASDVSLDTASVLDVVPTLLHGLGEPIPADADGAPLGDVYAEGSPPATTAVRTARYDAPTETDDGRPLPWDAVR